MPTLTGRMVGPRGGISYQVTDDDNNTEWMRIGRVRRLPNGDQLIQDYEDAANRLTTTRGTQTDPTNEAANTGDDGGRVGGEGINRVLEEMATLREEIARLTQVVTESRARTDQDLPARATGGVPPPPPPPPTTPAPPLRRPSPHPAPPSSTNQELLRAISTGVNLRHIETTPARPTTSAANPIAAALIRRRLRITSSSTDSTTTDNQDWED